MLSLWALYSMMVADGRLRTRLNVSLILLVTACWGFQIEFTPLHTIQWLWPGHKLSCSRCWECPPGTWWTPRRRTPPPPPWTARPASPAPGSPNIGTPGLGPDIQLVVCLCRLIIYSAANRLIGKVVQSRRRPLLGPSPSWKRLLPLSHLRHY